MTNQTNDPKTWKVKITWFDNGRTTKATNPKITITKETKLSKNPFKIKS